MSGLSAAMPTVVNEAIPRGTYNVWQVFERRDERRNLQSSSEHPHYISGKKSWSTSFKAHVHANEVIARRRETEALRRDTAKLKALAKAMGLDPDLLRNDEDWW